MSERLLKSSQVRSRVLAIEMLVDAPVVLAVVAYLHAILSLSGSEWVSLALIVMAYAVVVAAAMEPVRRREIAPIVRCLAAREAGLSDHEQLRAGFAAVVKAPAVVQRGQFVFWVAACVGVPIGMSLAGHASWSTGFHMAAMIPVALTGAIVSSTFGYFLTKEAFAGTREGLGREFDDPDERQGLITRMSIAWKIRVAVAGTGLALMTFVLMFSYARAREAIYANVTTWQEEMLAAIAPRVDGQADPDLVVAEILAGMPAIPFQAQFFVSDPAQFEGAEGVDPQLIERHRQGQKVGVMSAADSDWVWAWHGLDDGNLLTSRVQRSHLSVGFGGLNFAFVTVALVAVAALFFVSQLLTRDISGAIRVLLEEAERLTSGDLRRGRVLESEDEFGDLGRAFERMSASLRSTIARVTDAADRVDAAATDMAGVSDSVGAATADQVRRIQQAGDIMGRLNSQVATISDSAQALNSSVEESSSSILELGAASDELNDTASVLSGKVEEVSHSIEQMVSSVNQVSTTSESLSDVAADTSSSMEQMASAMRAVDTTAELTAKLSQDVVASAETGQAKVSQTIAGMQAISEATVTAERVIRGLGARTSEIGAILDVIDDVADETNLLALNAAIIAAQAGEHGKAFSVVADEIKELADRVLASTKEIGSLISAVQDESNNAIGAIENGAASVASGVDLAAEAGTSLEEINRASRESGDRISQIVTAVREQTKAATFVVSLMDRVRSGVEQINTAGSEQGRGNEIIYRSSVTMRDVSQQVRRTTEEQSRGFGRIRESVEGVREVVEQINGSLQEQSGGCHQVTDFLEQVWSGTRSNEEAVQRLGESIRSLVLQAEELREDVSKFQV